MKLCNEVVDLKAARMSWLLRRGFVQALFLLAVCTVRGRSGVAAPPSAERASRRDDEELLQESLFRAESCW